MICSSISRPMLETAFSVKLTEDYNTKALTEVGAKNGRTCAPDVLLNIDNRYNKISWVSAAY